MRTAGNFPQRCRPWIGGLDAALDGFTRTDLLAVLGVLILLVMVFVPALTAAGDGAAASGCLNNLRRLTQAWMMFATDHNERLPGNGSDFSPGNVWVYGSVDVGGAGFSDAQMLLNPQYSQLGPYAKDAAIYRCPADLAFKRVAGREQPHARSYSMNHAVGTKADGYLPVDGAWLDNSFGHVAGQRWRTYGKLTDLIDPSPPRLFVFIGEHPDSINDGVFAIGMPTGSSARWIDFPAAFHSGAGDFGFADGSAGLHAWRDARTMPKPPILNFNVAVPNSPDQAWLAERTSALIK